MSRAETHSTSNNACLSISFHQIQMWTRMSTSFRTQVKISKRLNGAGIATFSLNFCAPWDLWLSLTRIKSMPSLNYHYMRWFMTTRAFRAHVLAGDININSFDWPVFCYDKSKYDPENPKQGLFQGYFLLRVYRHIFSGPSSALKKKDKGRNSGQKNCLLAHTWNNQLRCNHSMYMFHI